MAKTSCAHTPRTLGLFIVYGTMLPFDFSASGELIETRLRLLRERPLRGLGASWGDVYSNILLFMPWGFMLALWRAGRGTTWWLTVALAVVTGAWLSGCVEFVQLFEPRRAPSLIDLITNTFGSFVGALIGWPIARWIWPVAGVRIRQQLQSRPLAACAVAAVVGLVIGSLLPAYSRQGDEGASAAVKVVRLIPFGSTVGGPAPAAKATLWMAELLGWLMMGGVFALAARESGRRDIPSVGLAIAQAAGLSLSIEAMQLVFPGHEVDVTSVVLAIIGASVGATLVARRVTVETRQWVTPALLIWGLAILMAAWNPPHFTWPEPPFLRTERIVPYWGYFSSRTLEDLTDVIDQALAFVPLGALLAAKSWRRSFLGAVAIGFGCGLFLEFGQAFLPERTTDMSDAISAAAGSGLGWALWRWGESARTGSVGATRYRVGPRAGGKR